MYYYILSFLPIITLLPWANAYTLLDQQCWHEHPLRTVNIYSSQDHQKEYASTIHIKERDYAPWSYPPVCTNVLQSINDKLCVYTSTSFSNGRGITIFTTPKVASRFTSLPGFRDSSIFQTKNINTFSDTWHATSIPNKGIGMLASKPLKFKDRVTSYTPVFLALLEVEFGTLEREQWWRLAVEQLPEKMKNEFLSLAYVIGDERVRVQDIVKSNTFQVHIAGVNHLAVFPETSRFNHACNPNAQYVIDTDQLTHTVHATRPIAEGEEITISYTSPLESLKTRQDHLESFHFTCTCPRCTDPTSDTTLSYIASLQAQLNDWSPTSTGSPALAEQLLQVHRDEGLEGFLDIAYGFAALAYNAVGDEESAREYAEKAKEAVLLKDGKWSANLRIWEEMLGDVRQHWSWRRRL
ncbi:hypothetical protein GQ44DRAFT_94110 [Phaeosphaeriaceae sp. PMI808]|nr:hypothetical protein GQ44DRAFT_94110 [Phaeosphaeriaceae sp. PMI808]